MRVGIEQGSKSYLPESYAYAKYLQENGASVELAPAAEISTLCDVAILFLGWRPFWQGRRTYTRFVHEYHSLSTGHFPRGKNVVKSWTERPPVGRIFLNERVRAGYIFPVRTPFIYRDMGVAREFYLCGKERNNPTFDIVYAGSIRGRRGVIDEIIRLAKFGLRLLVVGEVDIESYRAISSFRNIECTGRVERSAVPGFLIKARAGLNYMPDEYPYNIQTSTKLLEYLASGLGVLSTRYEWACEFLSSRSVQCLWLDRISGRGDFDSFAFHPGDVSDLRWENVLGESGFLPFIESIAKA